MKTVVIGASGRLGTALTKLGVVPLICDIKKTDEIRSALEGARPDVIINCAAITEVDRCETDLKEEAIQVHVRGVQNLLDANKDKLPIVHISTDFIFDGKGKGQYKENARPAPVNAYGISKYASELLLHTSDCPHMIVRTTQLYGSERGDFGTSIVRMLLNGNMSGYFFTDVFGNPTHVDHLALGIDYLLSRYSPDAPWTLPKVINIAGQNWLSRMEFAELIANIMGVVPNFTPVCYKEYSKSGIPRPPKAGLNLDYARLLGVPLFFAQEGIRLMLRNMVK